MSAIRRHPWRFVLALALVIVLAVTAGVLIYKNVYVNTHTAGEWIMEYYYGPDPNSAYVYELAAEIPLADGLTGVFCVGHISSSTSLLGIIVEKRPLGYEFLTGVSRGFVQPQIPPYGCPVQQWSSCNFNWDGEDYVLDFGAITFPEIEAVYVDGREETIVDVGDEWWLFYAVIPESDYDGEHSVLSNGVEMGFVDGANPSVIPELP